MSIASRSGRNPLKEDASEGVSALDTHLVFSLHSCSAFIYHSARLTSARLTDMTPSALAQVIES